MKTRDELRAQFYSDYFNYGCDGERDPQGMALDALLRELPEPLTPNERMAVVASIATWRDEGHEGKAALLEDVLARFPKPAPKQRTAEDLARVLRGLGDETSAHALDELVALAKRAEASK